MNPISFPKHRKEIRHKYGRGRRHFLHAQLPPNSWVIMFLYGKFALLTSTLAAVDIMERHQKE